MNVGVAILRLQEGFDCTNILADIDDLILKSPRAMATHLDKVARQRENSIAENLSLYSMNSDSVNSKPQTSNTDFKS